jgi:hypothetical protein
MAVSVGAVLAQLNNKMGGGDQQQLVLLLCKHVRSFSPFAGVESCGNGRDQRASHEQQRADQQMLCFVAAETYSVPVIKLQVWKAVGMDLTNVQFINSSEEINSSGFCCCCSHVCMLFKSLSGVEGCGYGPDQRAVHQQQRGDQQQGRRVLDAGDGHRPQKQPQAHHPLQVRSDCMRLVL